MFGFSTGLVVLRICSITSSCRVSLTDIVFFVGDLVLWTFIGTVNRLDNVFRVDFLVGNESGLGNGFR